jgi:cysteine synthase A
MGCAKYFNKYRPLTKLIAIDSSGSVTFGAKSGPRFIPGLGTSRRPEILDESVIGEIHYVDERNAVDMCRAVAKKGLLLGGSTGTVLSGIRDFADRIQATDVVVTISPDLGDKYLTTVYNDNWVDDTFKEGVREATSFEMEQV